MRSPVLQKSEMAMAGVYKAAADWAAAGTTVSSGRNRKSIQLHLSMKSDCPIAYNRVA